MFEPPEIHRHERLFVISVLGFIVNLIGIFVFQHGGDHHGHSHGGSGGGHSHSSHGHSHSYEHGHSHSNGSDHGHSHAGETNGFISNGELNNSKSQNNENKIFEGIFLHILADTLG